MDAKAKRQYEQMVLTPVEKAIPRLAVPTIISMMISMIYNVVDAYFVGRLGTSASAAIGILVSVSAVIQAVGFMFGHGSGSHISRRLGKGDREGANRFLTVAFWSSIAAGILLGAIGLLWITPLMRLLGSTETILPFSRAYGAYILISAPAMAASCVLNNVMRYEGKAFYAMFGLVAGGVLNMIGDPIFMFGMGMGIDGAGLSTALSQYISFFILLYMFISGKTLTKMGRPFIKGAWFEFSKTIQNGLPSLIRQSLNSVSAMTLNITAGPYGDAAIAAMAIVGRIIMLIGSVMIGLGQGLQPVAAFNYGSKKYQRVRKAFFFTWKVGEVLLGVLALVGLIFPAPLVRIFRDDPMVVEIGVRALRFQSLALLMLPLNVISNMLFQAIGKSREASWLSALRSGIYYIPVLLIMPRIIGLAGIESSQFVADILTTVTVIPLMVKFLRELPKEDEKTGIDLEYEK